jgi:hypothetical protein
MNRLAAALAVSMVLALAASASARGAEGPVPPVVPPPGTPHVDVTPPGVPEPALPSGPGAGVPPAAGPQGGGNATAPPVPDDGAPGVEVGPTSPGSPAPAPPAPVPVEADGHGDPAFWDLGGQAREAINDWFRGLVEDALAPSIDLIGRTLLSTPRLTNVERVRELWQLSLGIADALLVLLVIAAGAMVMGHETVQTRYALKDALPRLVLAGVAANASLALSGQFVVVANALSRGFLGAGETAQASDQLGLFIDGALEGGGIFLILLGLACAAVAVVLLVLYVVRAAVIVLLVCAAPLMLLAHALPQTQAIARMWWRGMTAALAVQVAQAFVLATAVRVFFSDDGTVVLGLTSSGGVINLLVALCLLWLLVKIPFWAKELAFSSRPSPVLRAARVYVTSLAPGRGA